jgi:hypothetical protein
MQRRKRLSPDLKVFSTKQKAHGKAGRLSPMQRVSLRLNDLARLFRSRYGITLPNDDAGRDDLLVAVHHLACLPRPRQAIMHWLEIWAPWMPVADASRLAAEVIANPQRWKADALAWRLRLTMEQRTMLGITTIGSIDVNKGARTKLRKQRDRQRKANQRRAKGATPRKLYEERSVARAKPWQAEGISRSTWYRRRETSACAAHPHETGPATA